MSSTDFTLDPGRKLIGAVFYKLLEDEIIDYKPPEPIYDFPDEVITIIKQYKPIESLFLSEEIKRISEEVGRISRTLESDNEWKNRFMKNLDSVAENIDKTSKELDKTYNNALQLEIASRTKGEETLTKNDENLSKAVENISKKINSFKAWVKVLSTLLSFAVLVGIGVLIAYISGFLPKL